MCLFIFRYDHPNILAGQGTMGLEILSQVPDLDACIIPVGGAGLIAGVALAIKTLNPKVTIIVSIYLFASAVFCTILILYSIHFYTFTTVSSFTFKFATTNLLSYFINFFKKQNKYLIFFF